MRNLFLVLLVCFSTPVFAAIDKPTEIADIIHANTPYGSGTYTRMLMKVYDATLWTDASPWSMDASFALTLRYHMHFTAQEIADRSIKEMQNIEPLSPAEAKAFDAKLGSLFANVSDGDEITALYIPHKGATLFYNGKMTGHIADDSMAQRFLNIWLSPKTSAPDLRKQLLKGAY